MPPTPAQILARLRAEIDTLPPQLQAAAKHVIDHPGDFGIDPVRVTAARIGVSTNALVRLAERLGFDGFDAFREPFRAALVTESEDRLGSDWLDRMAQGDAFAGKQSALARNEINIVARSLRLMAPERVQAAVGHVTGAKRCFVTATRASYALAYYFHYVGRMALPGLQLVPRHMGSALDDLLDADGNDCLLAITFAPYSAETIRSLRFARDRGARIVLISDSEVIAPRIEPDVVLPVSTQSLHHFGCFAGAMVVLDCLLGHLVAAGGDAARQRIADYEAMREDTAAYWKAPRKPRVRGG
ncbi:MurR/RpiR family transcriptional regulator [Ruegeria sediminis]|uniref:MurR/RpiR family transcriptional regulator n=1 Tax=Ruegeria sediminis TaxID=2583820 RepID=A0ABY2X1Z5_9RHOB|nr:MurR/RpiR family transcriptional regulator [Ruegeria sediminis]TMV08863.1 MurR/RpiR family transcriptional regulator [Ruegeria sediminis]